MTDNSHEEHTSDPMERFLTMQEIFYAKHIRPAIREDVRTEFEKCQKPVLKKLSDNSTQIKWTQMITALALIVIGMLLISLTGCTPQ